MAPPEHRAEPLLTIDEQQRGLRALAALKHLNEGAIRTVGPDSTELIRQMREERTRELMRKLEE